MYNSVLFPKKLGVGVGGGSGHTVNGETRRRQTAKCHNSKAHMQMLKNFLGGHGKVTQW